MKKVLIGVGLGLVAATQAHAWDGGIEDMRTMEANERGPVVRVKSVRVDGWHGRKYHTSPASYRCTADGRCHDGWRVMKKGAQMSHGSQCASGSHGRGCAARGGYNSQAAANQQSRAQRQAYYAAQQQRKAQLLAQKRRAVQLANQQRQRVLQQQRQIAAQRQAAAIQQQRAVAQRQAAAQQRAAQQRAAAQRQAAQQRAAAQRQNVYQQQRSVVQNRSAYQYQQPSAPVQQPVYSTPGCHGASQQTICSGFQRTASVNTHSVRRVKGQPGAFCHG